MEVKFAEKKSRKMKKWFKLIEDILPSEMKLWVFDIEKSGQSKVNHEFGTKSWGEIDGIIVYKNVVFIINGFSGSSGTNLDNKYTELKKFESINSPEALHDNTL